ncbi:MAG: hypothetical protein KY476_27030, partial [Planctomycetes bacterium]|nr:hypothetical protein [Planctomycetota bacterium]
SIVRDLPCFDRPTDVRFQGSTLRIRADQIIVWISLSDEAATTWHPETQRFPAILDTGCNHNLVIREDQLIGLSGRIAGRLPHERKITVQGRPAVELGANLWLHRNRRGERDSFVDRPPFLMEASRGIAVIARPSAEGFPRLPLLGLRAFRTSRLAIAIDCPRCRVTIRPARRFALFSR